MISSKGCKKSIPDPSSKTALLDTHTAGQSHLYRHTHTPQAYSPVDLQHPEVWPRLFCTHRRDFPCLTYHTSLGYRRPGTGPSEQSWDACMRNDSGGKATKPKRTTRGRGTEMWALRSRKGNQAGTKARKIRRNKSCRVEWRERRVCFPLWVPRKNTFLLAMDQHRQKRGCKGDKLTSLRSSLEGKDPRSRIGSMDFLGGIVGKIPPANAGDTGSIPCPGRSHRPVEQPSLGTTTTEPKL